MGHMLVSAVTYFVQNVVLDSMLKFLAWILGGVANGSTLMLGLPWMVQVETTAAAIAGALLAFKLGWEGLNKYILFNEGTADTSGGLIWKGAARAAFFIAADVILVREVFDWGLALGNTFLASPLTKATTSFGGWETQITKMASEAVGLELFMMLFLIVLVMGLVLVTVQMAIRGAEILFYAVAAPFVAVGQASTDGGVWHSWWKGLVILSLSNAWQFLALRAFMGLPQLMGKASSVAGGLALTLLFGLGLIVVALRGPHILREWSYASGTGGAIGGAASSVIQSHVTQRFGPAKTP